MRRAVAFLTPFGSSVAPDENTLAWFPLVGVLLGLLVGVLWWLAAKAWPPLPSAAVVVVGDLVLTGLLHFDGLADTGDGLLAPMSKERRLEVMADPAVGAFGAICVGVVLLLRFSAFASARPAPLVVAGLWCTSRGAMVAITEVLPYARSSGLVTSFLTSKRAHHMVTRAALLAGLALSVVLVLLGRGARGLYALGAEVLAMVAVSWLSWRRLGGYTGDVLGAAGVVGETVGLLILVTR